MDIHFRNFTGVYASKILIYIHLVAFSFANADVRNSGLWIPETEIVWHFKDTVSNNSPYGLGIDTEVRVQSFDDHTLRLKFENCRLYHKMNGTLDLPVSPIVSKYVVGHLEETVLVQLKQGHVKTFYVGAMEPNAVTNIKRAFLSKISGPWVRTTLTILKILKKEAILARLPLPHKTRKETSLLQTNPETTSSG